MRLSESLRKNILEANVGGVVNKFKLHKRRDTLFFEELLAVYVQECEKAGFGKELGAIGQKWMFLYFDTLVPGAIKRLPPSLLMNTVIRKVWQNLGLMDDFHMERTGDVVRMTAKNEGLTRMVGPNSLMLGFYVGIINVVFRSSAVPVEVRQEKASSTYAFRLEGPPPSLSGRTKDEYRRLNEFEPMKGYALKDALERKIFAIKEDNRISFRGKSISPVENTLFHLLGESRMLPEKMAEVSHGFFREVVKADAGREESMSLLKTMFQIMGWGAMTIAIREKGVSIGIKNPPHGLAKKDDWEYLFRTFLGYLWLFDRKLKLARISSSGQHASAEYSR